MHRLKERLRKRKWEGSDIKKALSALDSQSSHHHHIVLQFSVITSILMILLGNFLASLVLIPPLLALDGWFLYAVVGLLGFCLGLLFEILTRSISSLEHEHHVLLSLFIPFAALLSVLYICMFSNDIAQGLGIGNTQNPDWVSLAYAIAFVLPYAYFKFYLKKHYYSG